MTHDFSLFSSDEIMIQIAVTQHTRFVLVVWNHVSNA